MEDSRISLSSSEKAICSKVYIMNIPNFFTLPEFNNRSEMTSVSFKFARSTWRYRLLKEADDSEDDNKTFSVFLERINYEIKQQKVFYTITLLDNNDEKYHEQRSYDTFNSHNRKHKLASFDNDKPSYNRSVTMTVIIHLICHEDSAEDELEMVTDLLSSDFKKLLKDGKRYDLTLRVAGKEFRVHRDILMVRSPVFEAMLSHEMSEKIDGIVDLPDCDPSALVQFLFYVYSGKVERLDVKNAPGLYHIADKYNMMPLKEKCTKFIIQSLSPTSVCEVYLYASLHKDTDLSEGATKYFAHHASDVFATAEWKGFLRLHVDEAEELLAKASKKWNIK